MFLARPQLQRAGELGAAKPPKSQVQFELDIVGIPAIGGDAERTWGETAQTQWLGPRLQAGFPKARLLLWDHLTAEERAVEPNRDAQLQAVDFYLETGLRLSRMRVEEWADRLQRGLEAQRARAPQDRPIVFICHSTGGIVLKEVLCRSRSSALVEACLGMTFFATPHHGSNVLSLAACADTIKERLGLKWPLGMALREQLAPESPYLELLNQRFSSVALGIEIWSYCEEGVLALEVHTELLPQKFRGKRRLQLSDPVVDKRSAYMTTRDNTVTIEEEVMLHVNANHVTLPRLEDDEDLQNEYLEELVKLTNEKTAKERATHQKLVSFIRDRAKVSIFELYNEIGRGLNPVNVLPARQVALRDFLSSDFELSVASREPISDGPGVIVTEVAPLPRHETVSPITPHFESSPDTAPFRGRVNRLKVTDEAGAGRRLSETRKMSRSRSRHRSIQMDTQNLTSPIGANNRVSGQYLDSILLSGSSAPPQKEPPFTWIHTPYCVSSWVPQIMSIVSHKKDIPNLHRRLLAKEHWITHHNRARHSASHAQYVRSHFQSILADSTTNIVPGLPPPPTEQQIPDKLQFALFIPFLHWDTFGMQEKRSNLIKLRDKQDNPHYVDPELLNGSNLEHHIIWQYLLSESPVHSRRSLDQYGYPALRNTEVRDGDQVLFKKTRSHNQEQGLARRTTRQRLATRLHFAKSSRHKSESMPLHRERPPTVLTIDTLWLWILRHDTIVSFASKRQSGDEDPKLSKQADIVASIHRAARQDKLKDCYDLAALIVNKCVTALLEEANDSHLQVFHIFEEYLSDLTENYTNSFKLFRNLQRSEIMIGDAATDPIDLDPMDTYMSRKDLFHLFELRDITDELTTIRKLLVEQQKQATTMRDDFRTHLQPLGKGNRAMELLNETLEALDLYLDSVDTMLQSSHAMQKSYEKLLDMKSAKVNVDEAHAARMQTEVSTEQSKAVTIFTIVTIVFSPLSFMSSLFGMNVSEWSGVTTNPDLYWVMKVLGGVSLSVIVVALLVAFNRFTRALVHWSWEWIDWLFVGSMNLIGLGWLRELIRDSFLNTLVHLPRNPFSWSTRRRRARSPSSPHGARLPRSTTALSRTSTLAPLPTPNGGSSSYFWPRRPRRPHQDLPAEEEDLEMAKDEAVDEAHGVPVVKQPTKRRVPTFSNRTPRVGPTFNSVNYDSSRKA